MEINSTDELFEHIDMLIKAWCDRYCLKALRHILSGYPLVSGLTDEYGQLLDALKSVRALARTEITDKEAETVDELIKIVHKILYRKSYK